MSSIYAESAYIVSHPIVSIFTMFSNSEIPLLMDFVSQEHGVPHDGPKDSNAGAVRVRSWIATKYGDGSLETSERTAHCRERHRALPRFRALVVR
jgi:hypothetical protein